MRLARPALALALTSAVLSGGIALAADAPKNSTTVKSLFLSQQCGGDKEPVLEEKVAGDDGTCGYVGGLPIGELDKQVFEADDYTDWPTLPNLAQQTLDIKKKVAGQITMTAWVGDIPGGFGNVEIDVKALATLANGKTVEFAPVTVKAAAPFGNNSVSIPFELAVPTDAGAAKVKSFVLSTNPRGANFNMSAMELNGASWVSLPLKGGKK